MSSKSKHILTQEVDEEKVEKDEEEIEEVGEGEEESSVFDSGDEFEDSDYSDDDDEEGGNNSDSDSFEDQGSSSEDDDDDEEEKEGEEDDDEYAIEYIGSDDEEEEEDDGADFRYDKTNRVRKWKDQQKQSTKTLPSTSTTTSSGTTKSFTGIKREDILQREKESGILQKAIDMHTDDLSSDDEAPQNTIGRVPLHWYDDYDHIGYDVHGNKWMKGKQRTPMEEALAKKDDPNYFRTVYDAVNDKEIVLSDRDLEMVRRIQKGAFAHPEFNAYDDLQVLYTNPDQVDIFDSGKPIPKRRFLPSKWERMKVMKLVKDLKEGKLVFNDQGKMITKEKAEKEMLKSDVYMIWKDIEETETDQNLKGPEPIPAPKLLPPGHAESYNPPEEYLPTEEELEKYKQMDPDDDDYPEYIPQKFTSLRKVGAYSRFIKDRFERCLDLYLCPRTTRNKLNVDPDSLIPDLPKPSELRPFPTTIAMEYHGHTGPIRSLSISKDGQWLATGGDDGSVRIWEIGTGRCYKKYAFNAKIMKIEWNPNKDHQIVAVAAGKSVFLIPTGTGSEDASEITKALLSSFLDTNRNNSNSSSISAGDDGDSETEGNNNNNNSSNNNESNFILWKRRRDILTDINPNIDGNTFVVELVHGFTVTHLHWHYKGDYLATLATSAPGKKAVCIHQISKGQTQTPFRNPPGEVQTVAFHPSKPFFFVATKQYVRIYHLMKQIMAKKLITGCKWLSTMDIHPSGDHLILGSYDRKLVWFDLDVSDKPFKVLRYHNKAVRGAKFHPHYPLAASCADDGKVHIFHTTVYNDLMRDPLIVPLKILSGHEIVKDIGVLGLLFHPLQPWIFTTGADGRVFLYQDLH